jgi:Ser-tRNA(Ala) deacylase AlaX
MSLACRQPKSLYYDDEKRMEFEAKVLKVINNQWVVLDKTYFIQKAGDRKLIWDSSTASLLWTFKK